MLMYEHVHEAATKANVNPLGMIGQLVGSLLGTLVSLVSLALLRTANQRTSTPSTAPHRPSPSRLHTGPYDSFPNSIQLSVTRSLPRPHTHRT
jgi:hypothetical protein